MVLHNSAMLENIVADFARYPPSTLSRLWSRLHFRGDRMAQPQAGSDERFAHSVGEHFEAFLENYSSEVPEGMDTSAADEPAPRDYIDQVQRPATA
jgi:hypothetical protein